VSVRSSKTLLKLPNGRSVPRTGREWFDIFGRSKEQWSNDKTIIELGYRKISIICLSLRCYVFRFPTNAAPVSFETNLSFVTIRSFEIQKRMDYVFKLITAIPFLWFNYFFIVFSDSLSDPDLRETAPGTEPYAQIEVIGWSFAVAPLFDRGL